MDLIIGKSPIHGKGLFANRDFFPSEEILSFKGNPIEMTFLNHSCSPSCWLKEVVPKEYQTHIVMAGEAGVKKGEEVTIDYSIGSDTEYWRKTIADHCNCPKCKK